MLLKELKIITNYCRVEIGMENVLNEQQTKTTDNYKIATEVNSFLQQ